MALWFFVRVYEQYLSEKFKLLNLRSFWVIRIIRIVQRIWVMWKIKLLLVKIVKIVEIVEIVTNLKKSLDIVKLVRIPFVLLLFRKSWLCVQKDYTIIL